MTIFFFSFSIDKDQQLNVFKLDLSINFCVDDLCHDIPVLKGIHLPVPACNYLSYVLPGNGTLAGFLDYLDGEIGDSAIELVMQKFEISVSVV